MDTSYGLLIITCFCYGATKAILDWNDFVSKLINVLAIIAIFVLVGITSEGGFFTHKYNEPDWLNCLIVPAGAVLLGVIIGAIIEEIDGDWLGIFTILAGLGFVATIITTCLGL